jgi:hypothetical protein
VRRALCATLKATTFALGEAAPDTETLIVSERVFKALLTDIA